MKTSSIRNNLVLVMYGIILILFWQFISSAINESVIVPSPLEVVYSLLDIFKIKQNYISIAQTLKRTIASFFISLTFAVLFGFAAYAVPLVEKLLAPILYFLKVVPVVAIILLILIWSNSEIAPSIVGFLMVFPLLYEEVINTLSSIDIKLLNITKIYNVSIYYKIKDLYVPSIYFGIHNIISSAFGLAFKSIVAGEVLSHPKFSIGGSIYAEKNYLNTSGVLAWLIIMVTISIALDKIFNVVRSDKYRNSRY